MKILLTGGSGLLGGELQNIDENIYAPTSTEMNILNIDQCDKIINEYSPDVVLHAAAFISPPRCDANPAEARNNNIIGTVNLVNLCQKNSIKLVYISTDYAFDGKRGQYNTTDLVNPINIYAMTKVAGEFAVKTYLNSLIIRTSFIPKIFPYEKAYVDQYTSRDYIDVIAPLILKTAKSKQTGISHVGTKRKTVYELAEHRSPEVGKVSIKDVGYNVPPDTSLEVTC